MSITRNQAAEWNHWTPSEVKIIDGVVVKYLDVLVYTFRLGDVEDPAIYAAGPIYEWQKTDAGRWVMDHAVKEPYWTNRVDYNSYGYECNIFARLRESDAVFFNLKFK